MSAKDGGPAFAGYRAGETFQTGMSLRDYFAGQVIAGVFAGGSHREVASEIAREQQMHEMGLTVAQIADQASKRIAAMVYEVADAMIAERAK